MKNFCFDITQKPQELHRFNCGVSSKVISIINGKSHFEQLTTA